jgi:hypothetical protein
MQGVNWGTSAVCHLHVQCSCSGARIKTRKRNIAVPNDPSGFADNVIQFFKEKDGDLVSGTHIDCWISCQLVSLSVFMKPP